MWNLISTVTVLLLIGVSFIHIYRIEDTKVRYITKPLLMPLIIIFYTVTAGEIIPGIVIALIFGTLGDVFLMLPSDKTVFFGAGLLSFLIGHLFYIWAFFGIIAKSGESTAAVLSAIGVCVPYLIFAAVFGRKLAPGAGKLMGAVAVYIGVICTMSIFVFSAACTVFISSGNPALFASFTGSVLFIISDSIIAANKFIKPIKNARRIIMSSYIAGQFLIVLGVLL